MKYLLDTNIAVLYLNNDPAIVSKMYNHFNVCISTISVGELHYGFNNSKNKEKNMILLYRFFDNIDIIDVTKTVAYQYSNLRLKLKSLGKPIPDNDIWIAAIAQEHDFILVTRDKHFLNLDFIETEYW